MTYKKESMSESQENWLTVKDATKNWGKRHLPATTFSPGNK